MSRSLFVFGNKVVVGDEGFRGRTVRITVDGFTRRGRAPASGLAEAPWHGGSLSAPRGQRSGLQGGINYNSR